MSHVICTTNNTITMATKFKMVEKSADTLWARLQGMHVINAYVEELSLCILGQVIYYVTHNLQPQLTQVPYAMVTSPLLYTKGRAAPDYSSTKCKWWLLINWNNNTNNLWIPIT